ncbi:MAG: stage 0 sporulation family protein [bacterium]
MSIVPLPIFERDADPKFRDGLTDEEIYARLKPPTSIVVKFGRMKLVGEYPYRGDAKPGCGSKLVVRTFRAIEIAEMLTTTCSNSGCGKSVSRSEMLDYIENSGGREYPFQTNGEVLRVASVEDLNRATACADKARAALGRVREIAASHKFPAKIVDLELTLDETLLLVYYLSDERIDFREVAQALAREYGCRIEMRQVGARDEARLVADYERCGQHCCCKNFLKVLKPISMKSAKIQKATLDPLKISGRCGRLMCCLRYEDATYEELRKRLPKNKTRVGTPEGPGIVVDSKILVQLVLVQLDAPDGGYGREIAVAVEDLMDPNECPKPGEVASSDPMRGMSMRAVKQKLAAERGEKLAKQDRYREKAGGPKAAPGEGAAAAQPADAGEASAAAADGATKKKRRRRRKKKGGGNPADPNAPVASGGAPGATPAIAMGGADRDNLSDGDLSDGDSDDSDESDDGGDDSVDAVDSGTAAPSGDRGQPGEGERRKRRRRRRKKRGGGGPDGQAPGDGGGAPPPGDR